ncbi:hypothetical protein TRIATDRAFT_274646 [Trichoderma atroviride IMI 206040]|uniref:Uncharacterized protein n=1 Tax=Hypocrea atroviridis (strain ATCC 20476 / IMI 206040) TaxID=452589 RepID=G9NVW0_HYPAI|nr:uncharacterized protein TRIATDRAFT_274646 [Trichoderma atroviride IMI 206040]EHK45128.1 hypothetical protein TRIATDRAFT_274646 [Trichoderma atroviride IMI 206040]
MYEVHLICTHKETFCSRIHASRERLVEPLSDYPSKLHFRWVLLSGQSNSFRSSLPDLLSLIALGL